MLKEKLQIPGLSTIDSLINNRPDSKFATLLTELSSKEDLFLAGVIAVKNPLQAFPEKADIIVSPQETITDVDELNNFMKELVQFTEYDDYTEFLTPPVNRMTDYTSENSSLMTKLMIKQ